MSTCRSAALISVTRPRICELPFTGVRHFHDGFRVIAADIEVVARVRSPRGLPVRVLRSPAGPARAEAPIRARPERPRAVRRLPRGRGARAPAPRYDESRRHNRRGWNRRPGCCRRRGNGWVGGRGGDGAAGDVGGAGAAGTGGVSGRGGGGGAGTGGGGGRGGAGAAGAGGRGGTTGTGGRGGTGGKSQVCLDIEARSAQALPRFLAFGSAMCDNRISASPGCPCAIYVTNLRRWSWRR